MKTSDQIRKIASTYDMLEAGVKSPAGVENIRKLGEDLLSAITFVFERHLALIEKQEIKPEPKPE